MQSIDALEPDEQKRFAKKVLQIYGPLAEYMGLGTFKRYLEDRAFRIVDRETFDLIENVQKEQVESEQDAFNDLQERLTELCRQYGIKNVEYQSRVKSIYSTYNKIRKKFLEPNESISKEHVLMLNDILAWRVIVDTVADCYLLLGLLHGNWKHQEDEFDDYIVRPRSNGYKSLHTVIIHNSKPIEVQIRTHEMHEYNEFGPASHIAYKLQGHKDAGNNYTWTKDLITWQGKKQLTKEDFKVKAFSESIFVFTPKGKVIQLIKGATPIDFAFRIHTDLALHYIGAKVNGKMVDKGHILETGDIVEILVGKHPNVNRGWMEFARSNTAKTRIRKWVKEHEIIDRQEK
jgi:GTP pyrophosphokinase